MQLPRLQIQRFSLAIALFHLTFGFALYSPASGFSLGLSNPFQPQVHLLAAGLMLSGFALLLMARYCLQFWVRVTLTTLTLVPFVLVVSSHASGSSVVGIFVYLVLQVATLLLPWIPEPGEGLSSPDLLDLVLGFLQVGIVVLVLFTTTTSSDFGVIGDYPGILTLMGLVGAASLLWHRPIGCFSQRHPVRRIIGAAFVLLVAISLLHGERYVSGVLALHLWLSLLLLRRVPQRDAVMGSESFGATNEISTERLAELWIWLMLSAAVLLALADSTMAVRPPSTLTATFVLVVTSYVLVTQWVLPPMGAAEDRITGHLVFLALAQGLLLAPSSQISLAVLTPAVASCLLAARRRARGFIEELRAIGCRIAIDDFGVGFSSFSYLKHLPVDYLKIDGSFIRNLTHDKRDQHMVAAMVNMAQGLGIKTTAEWVGAPKSVTNGRACLEMKKSPAVPSPDAFRGCPGYFASADRA